MHDIIPVILSGGSGTRLWPLSREAYPKQFLPLVSERSMMQETVLRCCGEGLFDAPMVVANAEHRFLVAEQMRQIGVEPIALVLESEGRNTAPAAAVAALLAEARHPGALLLVLPSDHLVRDVAGFHDAVRRARPAAEAGRLVTFGIAPSRPETGYGYIRQGEALEGREGVFHVDGFVEKPDLEHAQSMLAKGGVLWNSGMFLFRADIFLAELKRHAPDVAEAARAALEGAAPDLDFLRLEGEAFSRCPSISIDHAVMERTAQAAVVPVEIGWTDVGAWSEIWAVGDKDEAGNVVSGDVLTDGAQGCLVRSEGLLTVVSGVEDLAVVVTADAVLVTRRDQAQSVKAVVERLRKDSREEVATHRRVYRPWGWYQVLDIGERFQVKCLQVKPGAKLSVQKHYHRAEHWVVVNGTALVTRDDQVQIVRENESVYIPLGAIHCLENPGKIPLNLIEVQSGSYLGEDDIVRIADTFGRI
ncbi:mannose-1-phosphate guanylyltransferase/mannose-6-phosphate isomerase [Telmatospirillum sp. J64-1]|uniref:mannose-1-phosphate guanylyltransferase/mannose-6-phosphate isomerase n=1 Tax=Telmatospirillum sp. J64-1 TaxID=2502183 RepID=UPI00115D65B8|nr:mannose-1-phosphate guanylyltransferase/mannose-6-phosphate isomerase [Telmatospirillum sp. J64-1]